MKNIYRHIALAYFMITIIMLTACATKQNTPRTRWWKAFHARYNTYFNGSQAYIEGALAKEKGNIDNYTEMIPMYTVGNKKSKEIGKSNFDKAIEKSKKAIHLYSIKKRPVWNKKRKKTAKEIEWLSRREYNPFLWKAWLLMGRSQFQKSDFDNAVATFLHMSRIYATQPQIAEKAKAWLAKSYVEQGFLYDAEDVIRNTFRDSIDARARKEWDKTLADYYIHVQDWKNAAIYIKESIKHEMRKVQKARLWFLLGQIEKELNHPEQAYKAFKKVGKYNPPYPLAFNAKIAMTEVIAPTNKYKMIKKLKRMASEEENKEYIDQLYYAIGNIYLAEKDTTSAITAYKKGGKLSERSGVEKGILMLKLGNLYWEKDSFIQAQDCFNQATTMLDKDRKDYEKLRNKSKRLTKLVTQLKIVEEQDSLQNLAKMNEADRNAVIDKAIEFFKKKEKEEKKNQDEEYAKKRRDEYGGMDMENNGPKPWQQNTLGQQNKEWYFYNPIAVSQGKETFKRLWGNRENIDDWQRINKTVVANITHSSQLNDDNTKENDMDEFKEEERPNKQMLAENDPHQRAFYLKGIPLTPETMKESNELLSNAVYNSGVIFKDQLNLLPQSEKYLLRVTREFPGFKKKDEAYYHLFLLYSRMNKKEIAKSYINSLKREYPKSEWTQLLTDPNFETNAKMGIQIEDSLYAATYRAFKEERYDEVAGNAHISSERFKNGANRDKFLFLDGLTLLNQGDGKGCLEKLHEIVNKFPTGKISKLAGMIINGVTEGRQLKGGKFDIDDVWRRRAVEVSNNDSIKKKGFTDDRNLEFDYIIAYQPDSINEKQLLFELAKYNFTNFMVRNFDIEVVKADGLHRMEVKGFRNYDEALQYARQLRKQEAITKLLKKSRIFIISTPNLKLLGTTFSYADYDDFYEKHFATLKISPNNLLTEPAEIITEKQEETTNTEKEAEIESNEQNNSLIINIEPETKSEEKGIQLHEEAEEEKTNKNKTTVVTETTISENREGVNLVKENNKQTATQNETAGKEQKTTTTNKSSDITKHAEQSTIENSTIVITNDDTKNEEKQTDALTIPMQQNSSAKKPTIHKVTRNTEIKNIGKEKNKNNTKDFQIQTKKQKTNSTGIYFGDYKTKNDSISKKRNVGNTREKKLEKKKKEKYDLEDEYYDLEGF